MASTHSRFPWTALAPVLVLTLGLFGAGFAVATMESFADNPVTGGGWTTRHYLHLIGDREVRASIGLTLWVATASTAISTVLALALALALQRLAAGRRLAYVFVQIPLAVPHLAIALTFVHLMAPSGWMARVMHAVGLIDVPAAFPALIYDANGLGIIAAYVVKEVPFLTVVTTAILMRLGPEYARVAATLGASSWQRLRHVIVPLVMPGLGAAASMVFAFVFAAFETPFLLGRPYPAMLPVVAQRQFLSLDLADRPGAIAMAVVMTVVAAGLVRVYLTLSQAVSGREKPVVF